MFIKLILYLFLAGAVYTDLRKDKIYNHWVIPFMLTGVITSALGGPMRLLTSVLAILASLLVLLPVYFLKGIAAGDVKLIMATASFLSFQELYSCILFSFLFAGAISLLIIIIKRNRQKTIHFALPVLAGTVFTLGGFL